MDVACITGSIRVDTATQKGSVIDVIRLVQQCNASDASTYLKRLINEPGTELGTRCPSLRINGKGQATPFGGDCVGTAWQKLLVDSRTPLVIEHVALAIDCRRSTGASMIGSSSHILIHPSTQTAYSADESQTCLGLCWFTLCISVVCQCICPLYVPSSCSVYMFV